MTSFRNELPNLLPDDPRAKRLAEQTFLLTEFLSRQDDYHPPVFKRNAIVHAHCHHHAVIDLHSEKKLMDAMELDYQVLDSGCCGIAWAFGFEKDHYPIFIAAAERVLLPMVRAAPEDTLIITNDFSCAEQIRLRTGIRPLHMAEVIFIKP